MIIFLGINPEVNLIQQKNKKTKSAITGEDIGEPTYVYYICTKKIHVIVDNNEFTKVVF